MAWVTPYAQPLYLIFRKARYFESVLLYLWYRAELIRINPAFEDQVNQCTGDVQLYFICCPYDELDFVLTCTESRDNRDKSADVNLFKSVAVEEPGKY